MAGGELNGECNLIDTSFSNDRTYEAQRQEVDTRQNQGKSAAEPERVFENYREVVHYLVAVSKSRRSELSLSNIRR